MSKNQKEILDFKFNTDTKSYEVLGFLGKRFSKNIIIPATYNDGKNGVAPVTKIVDRAFLSAKFSNGRYIFHKHLDSVKLPHSLVEIGAEAFKSNNISYLTIPNNVKKIGSQAFLQNGISDLYLGKGVEVIEDHAFAKNKIRQLRIPNSTKHIGVGAFLSNNLNSISFYDWLSDEGIKKWNMMIDIINKNKTSGFLKHVEGNLEDLSNLNEIGSYAFAGNRLTKVSIAKNVKVIGESAFESNKIATIEFPYGVKVIGSSAFKNNLLKELVIVDSIEEIKDKAFAGNETLTSVKIPITTRSIADNAFENVSNIVHKDFEEWKKIKTMRDFILKN